MPGRDIDAIIESTPSPKPLNTEAGPSAVVQSAPPVLPELTANQVSQLPKEVADLVANAKAAIASSTKRYQDAAALQKDNDARSKELTELLATTRTLLEQSQRPVAQAPSVEKTVPPPDFVNDPVGAFNYALQQNQKLQQQLISLEDKVGVQQTANLYKEIYTTQVKPNFPNVSPTEIRIFFEDNPTLNPDDPTVWMGVAQKISEVKRSTHDVEYQQYIADKEKAANEARGSLAGPNVSSLPPGKKWIDMSDAEQNSALASIITPLLKDLPQS